MDKLDSKKFNCDYTSFEVFCWTVVANTNTGQKGLLSEDYSIIIFN